MLGMGPMEIAVILVIALIIFGPGKLPEIGQTVGRAVRDFRSATQDFTGDFQETMNELQATADDLKSTALEFQEEAESTITGVKNELTGVAEDFEESTASIAAEVNESLPLDQIDSVATRPSPQVEAQIAAAREELHKPQTKTKSMASKSKSSGTGKKTSKTANAKKSKTTAKAKSSSSSKRKSADERPKSTRKRRQREPAAVATSAAPSKEDPLADLMGVDDGPILSSRSRGNGRRPSA